MLRSTLGADFASVPSADDIEGTNNNMLSDKVLDGEKYPHIRIVGTGPVTSEGRQALAVKVELLGRTRRSDGAHRSHDRRRQVRAKGEFELNHADLGMKPFSVMAGRVAGRRETVLHATTSRLGATLAEPSRAATPSGR